MDDWQPRFGPGVTLIEYPVRGHTHTEVDESITREQTATVPNEWTAFTLSRLHGVVELGENGRPTLTRSVQIQIFLPTLVEGGSAEAECFRTYRTNLEAHEMLHVENARRAADALVNVFRHVSSVEDFQAGAAELQTALERQDVELDRRTDHGGRDCRWPPPGCPHVPRLSRGERRRQERLVKKQGRSRQR